MKWLSSYIGGGFCHEAFTQLEPKVQHWEGVCVYGYVEWQLMRIVECTVTVGG